MIWVPMRYPLRLRDGHRVEQLRVDIGGGRSRSRRGSSRRRSPLAMLLLSVAPSTSFSIFPKTTATVLASLQAAKDKVRERLLQDGSAGEVPDRFDFTRCTFSQYQDGTANHTGKYAAIRAGLDVSYHGTYSQARQALQDGLLDDALMGVQGGRETPWVVFTAGAMGSGKSHVFEHLVDRGVLPLQGVQILDPDMFKASLPEWRGYLKRDPHRAGFHTRRESGYLLEVAQEQALRDRRHVWVDGSLRDGEWYSGEFERISREHPAYKIAIVHVVATRSVVLERAERRAQITGRHVPISEIDDSLARVPRSVERLRTAVDFLAVVDNSAGKPFLVEYCDDESCKVCLDDWGQLSERLEAGCDERADGNEPDECVIASRRGRSGSRSRVTSRRRGARRSRRRATSGADRTPLRPGNV